VIGPNSEKLACYSKHEGQTGLTAICGSDWKATRMNRIKFGSNEKQNNKDLNLNLASNCTRDVTQLFSAHPPQSRPHTKRRTCAKSIKDDVGRVNELAIQMSGFYVTKNVFMTRVAREKIRSQLKQKHIN